MYKHVCSEDECDKCNHRKPKCRNKKPTPLIDDDGDNTLMKNLLFILILLLILGVAIINIILIVWGIMGIIRWARQQKSLSYSQPRSEPVLYASDELQYAPEPFQPYDIQSSTSPYDTTTAYDQQQPSPSTSQPVLRTM